MSPFASRSASSVRFCAGGDDGIRTHDPLLAGQVLSQLSYTPMSSMGPEQSLKIEQQQILILKNLAFFFGFFYQ